VRLLARAHEGEESALDELVARQRDWLWRYVRRHMNPGLRAFETSEDVLQDVLYNLFRRGPVFVPRNEGEFRRLVATIVLNRLADRHAWARAERRDKGREAALQRSDGQVHEPATSSVQGVSRVAMQREEHSQVQLALELLDPDDARIIRLRKYDELEYAAIAEAEGIAADAARMRYNRALRKLGAMIRRVEEGSFEGLAPDAATLDAEEQDGND
jgi:RNA polymerase sigma-70 factor (ECF subfamily)